MMLAFPGIDFIIVNYNNADKFLNLFDKIYGHCLSKYDFSVILVENQPSEQEWKNLTEGLHNLGIGLQEKKALNQSLYWASDIPEAQLIKQKDQEKLSIIVLDQNTGYSGGNNIGIQFALLTSPHQFIWILNNDIDFPELGTIDRVFHTLEKADSGSRVISPPVMSSNNMIRLTSSRTLYNTYSTKVIPVDTYRKETYPDLISTDHLIGCSLIIPKKTFLSIGLFDDRYFLYGEESDWQQRCLIAGYSIFLLNTDPILHQKKFRLELEPYQVYYKVRNLFLSIHKNYLVNRRINFIFIFFSFIYMLNILLRSTLLNRESLKRKEMAKAFRLGISDGIRKRFGYREFLE
jgi:GT2 family glycosyltransferase